MDETRQNAVKLTMDKDSFAFVIYMIHACATRWSQTPSDVYKKLQATDCISNYLVKHYDVLHTLSSQYLVDDIQQYLAIRGVTI